MPLIGRSLDLDGDAINPGPIYDAILGPGNDLYTAVRASIGTTSLYRIDNARGAATFQSTMAVSGGTADMLVLGDQIGTVIRRPGADAFASSTILLELYDPDSTGATTSVTLATGRLTNPSTAVTDAGFAISYENSAIGRGDEFIQFHDPDGDLIQSLNVGAQFTAQSLGLTGGTVAFLGQDSTGPFGQIYTGQGDTVGTRFETDSVVAATPTQNGGFALAVASDDTNVQILRYDATGARTGAAIPVDLGASPTSGAWDGETLALTETPQGLFALNYLAETFDQAFFRNETDAVLTVVTPRGNVAEGPVELIPGTVNSETNPGFADLRGDAILATVTPNDLPRSNTGVVVEAPDRMLDGTNKRNTINGNAKDDLIQARGGNDTVNGKNGSDILFGEAGNDTVQGGNGADRVVGGAGNDQIDGQKGGDLLLGAAGKDTLTGGSGKDTIDGGTGKDRAFGGNGNDTFWMSAGNDTVTGGKGADSFVFYQPGTGKDILTDFEDGKDTLLISGFDADQVAVTRSGKNVRVELTNPDDASDISTLIVQNAKVAQVEDALDFI